LNNFLFERDVWMYFRMISPSTSFLRFTKSWNKNPQLKRKKRTQISRGERINHKRAERINLLLVVEGMGEVAILPVSWMTRTRKLNIKNLDKNFYFPHLAAEPGGGRFSCYIFIGPTVVWSSYACSCTFGNLILGKFFFSLFSLRFRFSFAVFVFIRFALLCFTFSFTFSLSSPYFF